MTKDDRQYVFHHMFWNDRTKIYYCSKLHFTTKMTCTLKHISVKVFTYTEKDFKDRKWLWPVSMTWDSQVLTVKPSEEVFQKRFCHITSTRMRHKIVTVNILDHVFFSKSLRMSSQQTCFNTKVEYFGQQNVNIKTCCHIDTISAGFR